MRVKTVDVIFFTKYLSVMLKAGLPIVDALSQIESETKNKSMRNIISKVKSSIESGDKFSSALMPYKKIFGSLYINLIRVSEESGTLEKGTLFLEEYLSKRFALQKKIKSE